MVSAGELRKTNYIHSTRLNLGKFGTKENILRRFAPHDISFIRLLLAEIPREVLAHGASYLNQGIGDITVTTINFSGDIRAYICVTWFHP